MADAIVSNVLEQFGSVVTQQIKQRVKLVVRVDEEVMKLISTFQAIQVVVLDAEQREIKETPVRVWLEKLKDVSYEIDDALDEWRTAIQQRLQIKSKVCYYFLLPCSLLRSVDIGHDIASKIKAINESLDALAKEKDMYNFNTTSAIEQPKRVESTSFIDVSEVFGRDEEKNVLVSKLLSESCEEQNGLHIISIVGMGGIGKTTLAQLVYNNNEVKKSFEKRMWVCVSDPFDVLKVSKAIAVALECPASELVDLESCVQKISQSIRGKKFLLVLDDVWTEDSNAWEPLHHCLGNGLPRSKILVTTHKQTVAHMMDSDIISIEELPMEHCWSLFKRLAFVGRHHEECQQLDEIGREIVSKCKGFPLAVKTMGSLLHFKKTRIEWESILHSEMWKLKEFEIDVFAPMLLSYYDLPSMVKRCFTYCAIFPKDFKFEKDELIKLWMAQGYLGLDHNEDIGRIGEKYFNSLAVCSFFREFEKDDKGSIIRCKMYDIVHDLAQYLCKNECCMIEVKDLRERNIDALCVKTNQLMLMVGEIDTFPISICNFKKLRSLLIHCDGYSVNNSIDKVLPKLFDELLRLRALRISCGLPDKKHIPETIGQLVHLRYLDLSNNDKLRKLPGTLCELYNLQTLKLDWCENLEELPEKIGKLVNLRYLMNCGTRSLRYIPKGIEKLKHLRTLSEFHWSGGYGGKACSLKYLNKYWQLAPLHIKGVGDMTKVIDQIAGLKNFKNIRNLSLVLGGTDLINSEIILAALQPPPNLEVLTISNYPGDTVSTLRITPLTNLRWINLSWCINCLHLPPLGKLSSLETLVIERMDSVGDVGNEFLGVESAHASSSSSVIYFPKLETLRYSRMPEWEVWDFGIEDHTRIMPSLRSLKIHDCKKLKGLPKQILQKATLENLLIEDCPILEQLYEKGTGENWHDISHIPKR